MIAANMKIQCKCHGVSGSCETRTCWNQMPNFRFIGARIKENFDNATEVVLRDDPRSNYQILAPKVAAFKQHTATDLVYLRESPNFCRRDKRAGSLGTRGRLCNKTSQAIDGCELMCCGRGFETRTRTIAERCNCKFKWCCEVECDTCTRQIEEHFCR